MDRVPPLPRPRRPRQISSQPRPINRTGGDHTRGADRITTLDESQDDVVHHITGLDPVVELIDAPADCNAHLGVDVGLPWDRRDPYLAAEVPHGALRTG